MSDEIPTGKTYLGFVLLWGAVLFVVWIVCIPLFATGRFIIALVIVGLVIWGILRHSASIGRRAKRSIRRNARRD